ncbi:YjjG family noncanonical pyrimidine nucleotidase [Carboxylicivirga mesophila]|uniref:YjjG family noncanonical pyrimidine nucleotidase n=1 Tax=Carboxylicivirga mesophila TaxID=1166478 RepID=A0ABS5KB69_9BACT|nr:YjjG family noncanonical pyrimidine nucleotidase [Carboxylicivirga mesophila]MBS2211771.1 YjjG family noncanonical pyrimidine nucleotidase [Carboxylicivirga mesophila]
MKQYKHLFFDLDHTLWDFEANSEATLKEMFVSYKLSRFFKDYEDFHQRYEVHNLYLWAQYRRNKVDKKTLNTQRFYLPFAEVGFDDLTVARQFASDYLSISATKTLLFPNTLEVLEQLQKDYQLHIITNGFKEVQIQKLINSGLRQFFTNIYISELIGVQKPNRYFFDYTVKSCHAKRKECLVIGDSLEADIMGAKKAGIDQVFFNTKQVACKEDITYEISDLKELLEFL